jgi:cytochrome b6-f complex iron-sulfur subunit
MTRNEFLKDLGFKGAALMAVYCASSAGLTSCKKDETVAPLTSDISLDLTASANASLKTVGGYIVDRTNNIVVARISTSAYAAVTLICSDEQKKEIIYRTDRFYCTAHGAEYNNSGVGIAGPSKNGLKVYQTALSGNTLTIKAG